MQCDYCGMEFSYSDNEAGLCSICFSRVTEGKLKLCTSCGRYQPSSLFADGVCDDCIRLIKYASFKPKPRFKTVEGDTDNIFIGFELEAGELEYRCDCMDTAEVVNNLGEGFLYLKEDCSIPDYGFEVVTHPASLQFHRQWKHDEVLKVMREAGMLSHDADEPCGLHVHVNRSALSSMKWLFVDWFVNKHKDFWIKVARREDDYYAAYTDIHYEVHICNNKLKDICGKSSDKFVAVNFCHTHSVEFRIFRGTLHYKTLLGTLELIHALISWAKEVKMHDVLLTGALPLFIDFVKTHDYPAGVEYLKARRII